MYFLYLKNAESKLKKKEEEERILLRVLVSEFWKGKEIGESESEEKAAEAEAEDIFQPMRGE